MEKTMLRHMAIFAVAVIPGLGVLGQALLIDIALWNPEERA
jgi:hypothetical protein